ncbi:MAG: hypothetical protein QGI46_02620 [Planctomycetota bacterium]|jgi:hypothetical protein|nr:hypothetical protein [Planctomycetota bacterium]
MEAQDLEAIARELNVRAAEHAIGTLQDLRVELKQLPRHPGKDIFRTQTIWDRWAFHWGGRTELQFNIGLEDASGADEFRHGVAFSLETGRNLPTIDVLVPKMRLFNDYIRMNPDAFSEMRMWHYADGERSSNYMPGPIPFELVREGVFIFLGKKTPFRQVEHESVLEDFDALLPLYQYVESNGASEPVTSPSNSGFNFRSGCTIKLSSTTASQTRRQLDVSLRHNELQWALHDRLVSEHGAANVGTELGSGAGTSVDVVVRQPDGYWFYEIKTARSPRACIREAVGQLLEYAFWPGAQEARRLVVVGETVLDAAGSAYLQLLNQRFSLPIQYEQVGSSVSSKALG